MNLISKPNTTNTTPKQGRKIEYIVIHYTAGVSSSGKSDENTAAWFARLEAKASSDFIVDDDSVTQFNGDIENRYTWHCGGSRYDTKGGSLYKICTNANSIGVEICSSSLTGKTASANASNWRFTDAAIDNAAELVKFLMDKYSIPADRVVRHYDVTGKLCPGIIGWNADSGNEAAWLRFKERIAATNYKQLYEATLAENRKLKEILAKIAADASASI